MTKLNSKMSLYSIKVEFMCKSCKSQFRYVDQFIEHKIQSHFTEFQRIKSILFEESIILDEHQSESRVPSKESTAVLFLLPEDETLKKNKEDCVNNAFPMRTKSKIRFQKVDTATTTTAPTTSIPHLIPIPQIEDNNSLTSNSTTEDVSPILIKQESLFDSENESNLRATATTGNIHYESDPDTDITGPTIKYELSEFENEGELDSIWNNSNEIVVSSNSNSSSNSRSFISNNLNPSSDSPHWPSRVNEQTGPFQVLQSDSSHLNNVILQQSPIFQSSISLKNQNRSVAPTRPGQGQGRTRRPSSRKNEGPRPFKCKVLGCISAFSSSYSLTFHVKIKHSEGASKEFACQMCDRRFFTKGELKMHGVVHTDERPFKCTHEGCTAAYKRKNKLTKHQRSLHGLFFPVTSSLGEDETKHCILTSSK